MRKFSFRSHQASIHLSLRGEVEWELVDPRTGIIHQSGRQSNLILDQGLDNFGSEGGSSGVSNFRSFFCVGEGTTEPAVTQTALVSERVRSNSNGGFTDTQTGSYNSTTKVYTCSYPMTRVINFTAGQNFVLTEFGFANASSGGLSIRELFRTAGGDPTSITDTASKQLRMTHTLTITVVGDWAQVTSFPITGVGTVTGVGSFFAFSGNVAGLASSMAPASTQYISTATALNALPAHGGASGVTGTINNNTTPSTNAAYVSGTYSRKRSTILPTSGYNGTIIGLILSPSGTISSGVGTGYVARLDSGFTKTNTQQLTLEFTTSWSR